MRRGRLLLPLLATAAALCGAGVPTAEVAAQQRSQPCILDFQARDTRSQPNVFISRLPGGARETYAGGGVRYSCRGEGVTLEADSTRFSEDTRILRLIGNVRYREPRASLDADRMTYYLDEEWLIAENRVSARLPSGSTMNGPYLEYYRAVPGVRVASRTIATGRPTLSLIQQDSTGAESPPTVVVAQRIRSEAETQVYAAGNVIITREDLVATGDSAMLDEAGGFGRLMRQPVVRGTGEREYTLSGQVIDFFTRDERIERVLAVDSARVLSEDLSLAADTIDLRIVNDELEQLYAWGGGENGRARAISAQQDMQADSIHAVLPGQVLSAVTAIGSAYAESVPDSTQLTSEERDWIRGDTIVAHFDPPAPEDTTNTPRPREMIATGSATSFYQMPAAGRCVTRPAANYVRGRQLTVRFRENEVATVSVLQADEPVSGVYLEPHADPECLARQPEPPPGAVP